MKTLIRTLLTIPLLTAVATAQIGTLTIPDNLSVYVERGGKKFFGGTIPKGSKRTLRRVSFDGFKNGGGLTERVGLDTATQALTTEVGVFARANSLMDATLTHRYTLNKTATSDALLYSTTAPDLSSVKPGVHEAIFTLDYLSGTKVAITFGISNLTRFVTTKVAEVDIGDDNVIDWKAPTTGSHRKTIIATADARGVVVKLRLQTEGRFPKGAYNYWRGITTNIGFNWKPGQRRCDLTSRGIACGPKLTGSLSSNWRRLDMTIQGAKQGRFGLFVIGGGTPFSIRFPNTPCYLYARLHVMLPHAYDSSGQAKFGFNVPTSYLGMAHFQDLALEIQSGKLGIESTNSLMLQCAVR